MKTIEERYQIAKEIYAKYGVDTDKAIERLKDIPLSIQCWQGDDVQGFLNKEALGDGLQVTGNYPYKARTLKELQEDIQEVLDLLPGTFKLNLHSTYLDSDKPVSLDEVKPEHYKTWVDFAKKNHIGLDFNPTLFSSPMVKNGFTLSSNNEDVRSFWVRHCKACRKVGEYFGKELGIPCVTNIWIPDGYKDEPYDRLAPRLRLKKSLDEILEEKIDKKYNIDAVESKLFGIGLESYTTGNNEFYLAYAVKNNTALTLDAGHFHPTEYISDKISSVLIFLDDLLLHVSRPVRWDSDHVVILDDELNKIAQTLVRSNLLGKTHIGLDYFDGSINRIFAWIIGLRATQLALLKALLEPAQEFKKLEDSYNFTERLYLGEEMKTLPFGIVYDYFCYKHGKKSGLELEQQLKTYENEVLRKRG